MRPTLSNPEEYRLIKEIYFKETAPQYEGLDPQERLERMEAKYRQSIKSSR